MNPNDFEDLMRHQNMMFRSVAMENEQDNKIKIIDIINNLVTDRNKKVLRSLIIHAAEDEGMTYDEVDRLIKELVKDNIIMEPERGYIKRA